MSTIEHIGIEEPYGDLIDHEGGKKALKEMTRILKPNGMMLITVPYGKHAPKLWFRVYNSNSLQNLIGGLSVEDAEYFALKNGYWIPVSKHEAERVKTIQSVRAVVLLKLTKKA